jgi:hypothetical protein
MTVDFLFHFTTILLVSAILYIIIMENNDRR